VGATLSLAGVLVGGVGGFVVATTYDHQNPVERKTGLVIGVLLMLAGIGLFTAGWWL
jgi:sulfite exporter TauE/SafE